jgi:uncharacterized membrane protein (UPF0127 family)
MKRALPLLLLFAACPRLGADAATPHSVDAGALPWSHLDLELADGRSFGLQVELALTDGDRERGLMFRRSLPEGTGMLFVFPAAAPHTFWMKNTLIPLDMIFAATDGAVLGCVQRAEPMTLTGRHVEGASRYVLEVPGGWCAEHGVGPGARLVLGPAGAFRAE